MTALALALLLAVPMPDLRVRPPLPDLHLDLGDVVTKRNTQIALVTTAAVLLVVETLIVRQRANGHVTPTISQVLQEWGSKSGTLPWTAGVMAGHWWWNGREWPDDRATRRNAILLGGLSMGVVVWDVADHSGRNRWRAPVLIAGGVLAGHALWGQKERRP